MSSDQRREAILDAVSRQVVDSDMTMTTKELAQAAGVAEGTLFRVFDSKEDLLIAAFSYRLEQMACDDGVGSHLAALHELQDLQERLDAYIALVTDFIAAWVHMMAIFRRFLRSQEGQQVKGVIRLHKPQIEHIKSIYKEALSHLAHDCRDLIEPYEDQLSMPVDTVVAFVQSTVTSMAMAREFHDFGITAGDASTIIVNGVLRR